MYETAKRIASLHSVGLLKASRITCRPLLISEYSYCSSALYAEHFTLQPFLLTITFALDPARPIASSVIPDVPILIPVQSVVDMIGNMLGNIDSAQVRLSAFLAKDLLMGKAELFARLSSHYVRQLLRKFYKVVGSAALLGNPVGLFESVGSGVKAFFYEPIQGLSKGPEEFFDGLGRGAKTFLLNTTYGIANSASKITGTIGNGLSAIAGTETYRLDRAAGKSGIIYGVREGVLGMFKDSVNGARENGVMGAITGTGRGIVGLITKPVTGVLDDTTKIIESVKDATHVSQEMHRKRLPRYLYPDGVLTSFCSYLADGKRILANCMNSSAVKVNDRYMIHVMDNQFNHLLITNHSSMLISSLYQVLWMIPHDKLNYVSHDMDVIEFYLKDRKLLVVVQTETIASNICKIVDSLRDCISINVSMAIKQIASFYGEILSDEEFLILDQIQQEEGNPQRMRSTSQSKPRSKSSSSSASASSSSPSSASASASASASRAFPESVDLRPFVLSQAIICGWHRKTEVRQPSMLLHSFEEYEIQVSETTNSKYWIVHRSFAEFV